MLISRLKINCNLPYILDAAIICINKTLRETLKETEHDPQVLTLSGQTDKCQRICVS
jgi:hypothetical protein